MATKSFEMCLYFVLALMICRGAMAQQSSCSTTLMTLMPCLPYVTGNVSTPAPTCCTSLSNVVQSQPLCLCVLVNNAGSGSSVALAVNRTLAMGLPSVCNVQTPPVSQCNAGANGGVAPGGAPVSAPAPAALTTPTDASTEPAQAPTTTTTTTTTAPSIPSGATGSRTGPNSGSTSDGTSIITSSIHLPVVALFALAWIANAFRF